MSPHALKNLLVCCLIAPVLVACDFVPKNKSEEFDFNNLSVNSLLGQELLPPAMDLATKNKKDSLLDIAFNNFQQDSLSEDNIIWYGRRLAYLYKYVEAIEAYTKGLSNHQSSYRLLRHRGHRFISIRKFELAIEDLKKAAHLVQDQPLEVEPDGIPNRLNKPLSNTHFNIWYHLGLAYYLQGDFKAAAKSYETCLQYALNDDLLCAVVDWLYMTYRELGEVNQANKLLSLVHEEMKIIENDAYFKRIMMYQGKIKPEALLEVTPGNSDEALAVATQGFGLGNWYRLQGDEERATEIFSQVVKGESWSAFGFIAAEAMLKNQQ